ncbi:phage tail tape measure protein [Nitratidesulfovibrio liaohensis]|uniref:Phage tail tape measure protein n=1 Tax=Nitratidesulfovibrio liaohensis TaxID=2604158 RepID=A0ABY9QXX8_9BACT|nr:phage tail tape measure protein [Nitratidesulfovibrio liaohensis]WMW64391.1 phage tail tape measure protein [Nitratidesulfovibrio liaohensis]
MTDISTRIIISARDMATSTFRKVELAGESMMRRLTSMQGTIAAGLGAVGLGVGLTETLRETARFETALSDMGKVSDESFGAISKRILALPPELGTASELMDAYYQTMSAGVTEPVKALDMVVTASKAAKGAHVEQGETIKVLTKTMTGFAGELKTAAEASDLLFGIEKVGQTTFRELVPHVGSLAALSREVGVRATEMGGALALTTQTAGSTSDAATQLRGVLLGLYKPTEEMAKLFKRMGYESGQALVKDKGFVGALQAVYAAAEKAKVPISKLFENSEALVGLAAMSANGFSPLIASIEAMRNSVGMTQKAFVDWSGTLDGVYDVTSNTVSKLAQKFGNEMSPTIKRAMEDTRAWIMGHDADIGEWARRTGEGVESLTASARGLIDVYNSLPDDITGAAGNGLIARMLFGSWKAAAVVAVVTELNSSMTAINNNLGTSLTTFDNLQKGYAASVQNFQNVFDVLSGKRDWNTGKWLNGADKMLQSHGGGTMLSAHGDGASLAQAAAKAASSVTLAGDPEAEKKQAAALKQLRATLDELTKTDADLKVAKLRAEFDELAKTLGKNTPEMKQLSELIDQITETRHSPAELQKVNRDFDKELATLRAEAQVLQMQREANMTGGARKQSEAQQQAAVERARLEQQAAQWRKDGITEERVAERVRLEGIRIDAGARKQNHEMVVAFERAYRETVLGNHAARMAAIREEADAYLAAGADRVRVEEWVREQELRISRDASDGMIRALKDYYNTATDAARNWEGLTTNSIGNVENALVDLGMTGKASVSDMVDSMIRDIMRLVVRQNITGPLAGIMSGVVGDIGSLFGLSGARASGGAVQAGRAYLVGEERAEIFVPGMNGAVVPQVAYLASGDGPSASRDGAGTVVNNFTFESPAGYEPVVQKTKNQTGGVDARVAFRRMTQDDMASGQFDRAMSSRYGLYPRTSGR